MKTTTSIVSRLAAGSVAISYILGAAANAAVYVGTAYEGFDYGIGALGTANGGSGFNATGDPGSANTTAWRNTGGSVAVTAGSLTSTATGYAASSGEKLAISGASATGQVFRNIGQSVDSGSLYFSFLMGRTNDTNRTVNVAFLDSNTGTMGERLAIG